MPRLLAQPRNDGDDTLPLLPTLSRHCEAPLGVAAIQEYLQPHGV
ncbi:MAG: hypothetical protein WCG04_04580 [Alphaproteobacteria bacterium]